jgi:putative Holliday junction resolvase
LKNDQRASVTPDEPGRLLAIDYGARKVGLALSDPSRIIAKGAGTLENNRGLLQAIARIVAEQNVQRIIVGMPYAANGRKGWKAEEVDRFIEALRGVTTVPIESWDESFSSAEARRVFIEGGMKRKKRQQKWRIDEMAARLLLEDYMTARTRREQV